MYNNYYCEISNTWPCIIIIICYGKCEWYYYLNCSLWLVDCHLLPVVMDSSLLTIRWVRACLDWYPRPGCGVERAWADHCQTGNTAPGFSVHWEMHAHHLHQSCWLIMKLYAGIKINYSTHNAWEHATAYSYSQYPPSPPKKIPLGALQCSPKHTRHVVPTSLQYRIFLWCGNGDSKLNFDVTIGSTQTMSYHATTMPLGEHCSTANKQPNHC